MRREHDTTRPTFAALARHAACRRTAPSSSPPTSPLARARAAPSTAPLVRGAPGRGGDARAATPTDVVHFFFLPFLPFFSGAAATAEGIRRRNDERPFVLSRAFFAGTSIFIISYGQVD